MEKSVRWLRVLDIKSELERAPKLIFGCEEQIEKLKILRKAEDLVGTEHWDECHESAEIWDRERVYAMSVEQLLQGLY